VKQTKDAIKYVPKDKINAVRAAMEKKDEKGD